MDFLLSARTPHSPIIFDFAQFLINSVKFEDVYEYVTIICRLGIVDNEKFLEEMRSFWNAAATFKKPFPLDKVK